VGSLVANVNTRNPLVASKTLQLLKNILIYEFGSGNVGFGVGDIYILTYGFLGSVILLLT